MKFDNLIKLRESLGMTQKEFAESLNLNKTTYNNYETGVREPRTDFFEIVARTYDISVDYLLGLTNAPKLHKDFLSDYTTDENNHTKKSATLSNEAIEVAEAYEVADSAIKTSVRKLLDVEDKQSNSTDESEAV